MTNDTQTTALVFKDQAGNYFLLPQQVLEQGRVPEERKAEVEQLMADADTSGHALLAIAFLGGVVVGAAGALILDDD